jgi:hypothetical protein
MVRGAEEDGGVGMTTKLFGIAMTLSVFTLRLLSAVVLASFYTIQSCYAFVDVLEAHPVITTLPAKELPDKYKKFVGSTLEAATLLELYVVSQEINGQYVAVIRDGTSGCEAKDCPTVFVNLAGTVRSAEARCSISPLLPLHFYTKIFRSGGAISASCGGKIIYWVPLSDRFEATE